MKWFFWQNWKTWWIRRHRRRCHCILNYYIPAATLTRLNSLSSTIKIFCDSLRNRTLDFRLRTRVEKRSGRDLMRKFKVFAHSNCVRKASASGFYGLPAAGALVRFLTDARAAIDNHARPKVGRARTRPTRPVPAGLQMHTSGPRLS